MSGGRDSIALLHAACRAARAAGVEVVALHVHHGLLPEADAWAADLRRRVARWGRAGWPVRIEVERLGGRPAAAESVEAWARRERYAALDRMARAHQCSLVLLAHHRRDQAETVLLQALRSAGPAGLAAMPRERVRDGVHWVRPWIDRGPEEIEAYARRHRLRWVNDPSNSDPRYDRNRLRLQVWPALEGAFPTLETALAHVARWQQEANDGIQALAEIDRQACSDSLAEGALRLEPWKALSPGRRAGVLRAWLKLRVEGPPEFGSPAGLLMSRLLGELPSARTGARWSLPAGFGRTLHLGCEKGGRLVWLGVEHRLAPATSLQVPPASSASSAAGLESCSAGALARPGHHRLGDWPGTFEVTAVRADGVPAEWLACAVLRRREGGEQFQSRPGQPARSLKKQFQSAGIAAWAREGPLLWAQAGGPTGRDAGDQLLWVAGLGVDTRCLRPDAALQVQIVWHPDALPGRQAGGGEPR